MEDQLTLKHKLFCEYFASGAETCGNGVRSYALAYNYNLGNKSKYQSAKTNATRLLGNKAVTAYINRLLQERKLTPAFVDRQLDFLIHQNANLPLKLQAINTFYKINGKTPDEEVGHNLLSARAEMMARKFRDEDKLTN